MTLLQMAGMYQTIANDGVRIPPRIIKSTIAADGSRTEDRPRPDGIRVVSPETARRCATCCARSCSATRWASSRAPARRAAVDGYQIAGKTGTAQQINPACGCCYSDVYWITFAGMAPPTTRATSSASCPTTRSETPTVRRPLGGAAVPQHRRWLLQRENVPLSPIPARR